MQKRVEYQAVEKAITEIMANIYMPQKLGDAVAALRIVGEFSSGKTRFVREIFQELIPQPLLPISSLEKQTILPLELTYGEKPGLELISRENDESDAIVLESYDKFPAREAFENRDLSGLRLRLYINEPRLTLAEGDGYYDDKEPQRLRIIDEPGWNSEDEDRGFEELGLSGEWQNLGLVCICRSARLDSKVNHRNLEIFLAALRDGQMESFRDRLPLLFVITECAPEDREKSIRKQEERIKAILGEDSDKFPIKVMAVDFARLEQGELEKLREDFWQHILSEAPSAPVARDLVSTVRRWPKEWDFKEYIGRCMDWLEETGDVAMHLRPEGKFMAGRTMTYYQGMNVAQLRDAAIADWKKRLKPDALRQKLTDPPDLPSDHPLRPWLDAYWLPRLREPKERMESFIDNMPKVLRQLDLSVTDIEAWLAQQLHKEHEQLLHGSIYSFKLLCQLAYRMKELEAGTYLATLLSASLLEARYAQTRKTWLA